MGEWWEGGGGSTDRELALAASNQPGLGFALRIGRPAAELALPRAAAPVQTAGPAVLDHRAAAVAGGHTARGD